MHEEQLMQRIVEMAEGVPGAFVVYKAVLAQGLVGACTFASMYHMKLTGSKAWVAYKDFAGQDVFKLMDAIMDQDEALLEIVNDAVAVGDCGKNAVPAISLREAAGM